MKILYVGLDPTRWPHPVDHVPFIKVVPRLFENVAPFFAALPSLHTVLVTSRSAVHHLFTYAPFCTKPFIAVGEATAEALRERGVHRVQIAPIACGEGVCALLSQDPPPSLFYPHAANARRIIHATLEAQRIPYVSCILYDTLPCVPYPLPNLKDYDEVVFTSPSTVQAFFRCYQTIPNALRLTPIGPITQKALEKAIDSF